MAPLPWRQKDYAEYFERFLKGPGASLSKTRFGYAAVGEPSFIVNLQKGERKIRLATIERALDFVAGFKEQ
jgi:hypothetical protein